MKHYIQATQKTFIQVFKRWEYLLVGTLLGLSVFLLGVIVLNYEFIWFTLTAGVFTLGQQIHLIETSFGAFKTALPVYSQISLIVVSIFSAINISFFIYYIRRRVTKQRDAGVGFLGILSGFFGIGCGACGSVLLSSVFGISASSQVIGTLPLDGIEFSILGIVVLGVSTTYIAHKIQDPQVCPIELPKS